MVTQSRENQPAAVPPSKRIFISYSRQDYGWVNDYLKRFLAAADLNFVIDDESFEYGENLQATIEKFIEESHYTLLVMTPDWVNGKWPHFESVFAAERALAGKDRRLLPIKLKDCDIPPHIAPLLYLDVRDINRRDEMMIKLLQQLGVSDSAIVKAKASIAKKTLQLLIELMNEPAIREQVSNLREIFERVEERIGVLVSHKTLHDNFQNLQMSVKQVSHAIQKETSNEDHWSKIRDGVRVVYQNLKRLLAYAAAVKLDHTDMAFAAPLSQMAGDVQAASEASDHERLSLVIAEISNEVDFWLPLINDRIVKIVNDQPLQTLIECLQAVYERAIYFKFDDATEALLCEYRSAIESLVEYQKEIVQMNADHAMLQRTEVKLHLMCKSGEPTLHQISSTWRYIEPSLRKLKRSDSYQSLFAARDELCDLLNDVTSVRDDKFAREVGMVFRRFVWQSSIAFNELDVNLLFRCNELASVDFKNKLRETIRRMQNREANI